MAVGIYPELQRLFTIWFNEDWDFQYGTVEAAIADCIVDTEPTRRRAILTEIDQLLREKQEKRLSEEQFWDFLGLELGCRYLPPDDNTTAGEWLGWIKDKLQESLK